MPTPQNSFRDAAGRVSDTVSEMAGEQFAKAQDMAGEQFAKAQDMAVDAQDMAVDAYDQTHAAAKRNPLAAIGIALGIGFLFGALSTARR